MFRLIIAAMVLGVVVQGQEVEKLDKLLDERIALNVGYKKQFVAETKGMTWETKLKPIEEEIGQDWVDFVKHVRQSKDVKLKIYVLKIEIQEELRGSYYDLEFAETQAEFKDARAHVKKWTAKYAELKAALEEKKK